MSPMLSYAIVFCLTLLAGLLLNWYLQPYLKRILLDVCKTHARASFWVAYMKILLLGLPVLIALNFQPKATRFEQSFFEILGRLGGNLAGYLLMLIGMGVILSIFTLIAPRNRSDGK